MYNGKVLFVAGSGNDPNEFAAGTFESAVYDPTTGKFQVIPTPDDFFCAGHVQLADGNVLVLGGNKAYQVPASGSNPGHNYFGLNTSYIFDPVTDKYIKENNLNQGHWYPSATELGNGDIVSYGGLNQTGGAAEDIEYFKYDKSLTDATPDSGTDGKWLPASQINGDNPGNTNYTGFWGLYPTMVLTQNGELFYTGSHVFGNNETPVGEAGTARGKGGAGFLNIADITKPGPGTDKTTPVNGLQDTPGGPDGTDMTDQSMSVLLPPAQTQQVFLAGGGNINYTDDPGTRLTDLISLNAANPAYKDGPLLPRGALSNGAEAGRRRQDVRLDGAAAERERLRDRRRADQPRGPGLRGVHDQHGGARGGGPGLQGLHRDGRRPGAPDLPLAVVPAAGRAHHLDRQQPGRRLLQHVDIGLLAAVPVRRRPAGDQERGQRDQLDLRAQLHRQDQHADQVGRADEAGRGHPSVRPEPALRRAADQRLRRLGEPEPDEQPQHRAARLVHAVRHQREQRPVGCQMGPRRLRRGESE